MALTMQIRGLWRVETPRRYQPALPVRFVREEAGNYVIWDNGGRVGESGLPPATCGSIERTVDGWVLHRSSRPPTPALCSVSEAKSVYLRERPIPLDPATYVPQSEPPTPTVELVIGMGEWERLDDWRSIVFRALVRSNSPLAVTAMLTPVRIDRAQRVCVLRLPVPVAEHLHEWRHRS